MQPAKTHAAFSWLAFALAIALSSCRPGSPVVDPGDRPATRDGTISGLVRGPDNGPPLVGRNLAAINTATGERLETKTSEIGGYTFKVPPGRYRLELQLMPGETVVQEPGEVEIRASDLDPQRNFVVAGAAGR
jgi:hypothetical protein